MITKQIEQYFYDRKQDYSSYGTEAGYVVLFI